MNTKLRVCPDVYRDLRLHAESFPSHLMGDFRIAMGEMRGN